MNPLISTTTLDANGEIHATGALGGRLDFQFARIRVSAFTSGTINVTTLVGPNFLSIQISGTFTATVQFEASNDNSNWAALPMTPIAGGAAVTSATAAGLWSRTF